MMNKGTLISLFITTFILTHSIDAQTQIETFSLPALQIVQEYTNSIKSLVSESSAIDIPKKNAFKEKTRCIKPCVSTDNTALQITVDQIVHHVSSLIEGRPNSKKNIVAHLAAIISSIINLVAKIASSQSKQRDPFYHELNAKLKKVLAESAQKYDTHEMISESINAY